MQKKTLKIGVTGSRDFSNKEIVKNAIGKIKSEFVDYLFELHHGDCLGADELCHEVSIEEGFKVVIHPPNKKSCRAFCEGGEVLKEKSFLARNKDIVDSCDILLAFPKTNKEVLRSGTWATIRHGRKTNKEVIINSEK